MIINLFIFFGEFLIISDDDFEFNSRPRRIWYHVDELYEEELEEIEISNTAKSRSLRQWVTSRTIKNNFQQPADDEDNDKRPPASLWSKINTILKEEVVRIGAQYLSDDLKRNKDYFGRETRRSKATMEVIKADLKDKTIDNIQTSSGVVNTFGALVPIFYGTNQSSCYSAIANKVSIIR